MGNAGFMSSTAEGSGFRVEGLGFRVPSEAISYLLPSSEKTISNLPDSGSSPEIEIEPQILNPEQQENRSPSWTLKNLCFLGFLNMNSSYRSLER